MLDRPREVLRWEGARGLLLRATRRLLGPVVRVRRLRFYELDLLTRPLPEMAARVPLELRQATVEDIERLGPALEPFGLAPAEARRRLEAGDSASLGFCGGTLVHIGWITSTSPWIDEIGVWLRLEPGEACAYETVTLPEWRGLGIQPAASLFRNRLQRARGGRRHVSWAWVDNAGNASRKIEARGRRRTKTVWGIWLLGRRRPWLIGATAEGSPHLERPPADLPGGRAGG